MMEVKSVPLLKSLNFNNINRIFVGIVVISVVFGGLTGFLLSRGNKVVGSGSNTTSTSQAPKAAQQDSKTFRDFAEGTIQKRPASKNADEYVEGTHLLVRDKAVSVAITSSVVDLSQYEGKKVKVFGETQKAIKEGWLMDVGKVEVQ